MKKEDAKYILDAIEWMSENTTVASVDMETYYNLFMNSQNLLMDVVNDVEQSESNCNIPLVVNSEAAVCDECGSKNTQTIKYDRCLDCYNQFNTN